MAEYRAKEYWDQRLRDDFSLSGVGHKGFSEQYNRYMYRLKKLALERALKHRSVELEGRKVLDIGCGSGFFVDYYAGKKATVTGLDIADVSIKRLSERYPSNTFINADIGSPELDLKEEFDVINAFDVLYHIADDEAFGRAVRNMGMLCKQGGWVIFTDSLDPRRNVGEHVRYRDLETYRICLARAFIDVLDIVPVLHIVGMGFKAPIHNRLLQGVAGRIIELLAWPAYLLDRIYCPMGGSSIKLVLCRKR